MCPMTDNVSSTISPSNRGLACENAAGRWWRGYNAAVMLIAGIRHIDRVRGTGWLDCPNCSEHAAQDVIDDMTFVEALGYRFTPIKRQRVLNCRRCNFRRPMTPEEMRVLETGGSPIHRAVMAPVGIIGLAIIGGLIGLVYMISQSQNQALANANEIHYTQQNAQFFPATFDGPSAWNFDPEADQDPPYLKMSDSGGRMLLVIERVTDGTTLQDILDNHFSDQVGLNTTGFPEKPPQAQSTKIANQQAIWVRAKYNQGAENDEQDIYVFMHNGVGYVITYVALGDDAITTMHSVAEHVNGTFKFTQAETPPPAPSPSPGASPSASPSASAKP